MIIRDAYTTDPQRLGPKLRDEDLEEVMAASGHTGVEALKMGMKVSARCHTAEIDGEPVAMFGVAPNLTDYKETGMVFGVVWALMSPRATESPKEFMRLSRRWLAELEKNYTFLGNFVDARNQKHIRWLKAMGFQFVASHPHYGFEEIPFLEFYKPCEVSHV